MSRSQREARGLTLLELLLALTLLAAMMVLIAALWRQAESWTGDSASHQRVLRLPRVLELMRAQWAERRTSVPLRPPAQSVVIDAGGVRFVTTVPILHDDAPLVIASYRVDLDIDAGFKREPTQRLVYTETPIVNVGSPQEAGRDGRAAPRAFESSDPVVPKPEGKSLVLLGACSRLAWEWWGDDPEAVRRDREERQRAEQGDAEAIATVSGARPRRPDLRWRPIAEGFDPMADAIRLAGRFDHEEFACVMVIGDSR